MSQEHNDKIDLIVKSLMEVCSLLDSLKSEDRKEEPAILPRNRFKKLVFRDTWPQAAPKCWFLDPDSEPSRKRRAAAILDLNLERSIEHGKFLDLRCGTGEIPHAALHYDPVLSVGYDLKPGGWSRFPEDNRLILTDDFDQVLDNGPYDSVLLYDVLDHEKSPVAVLRQAAHAVADDGLIQVRVRPWSSRYGPDLRTLNKAFAHLFLSDSDLISVGMTNLPQQRVIRRSTYHEWIKQAGLIIRREKLHQSPVDKVFRTPLLASRIMELYGSKVLPEDDLSINDIDYTLEKPR